ncbi:hypothetical protein BD410DRAFT_791085 [Rickenella mellea]|uniref:Uncharacterized protein n=1 Tax=Rickenella mellea TaxID=50990 RepID=A0A4Y7Q0I0_9AGAM|nr:hypothetical protein BD410DRAFT_791085 [Rickenella mellea]
MVLIFIPVLLVLVLVPVYLFMSPSLRDISSFLYTRIGESYNYLTDGEVNIGPEYSILRHCRPFVVYQGVKTSVPVTVLGVKPLPSDRRVFLQRRGYRTAMFGWYVGGLLGGSKLPGIEVTPTTQSAFTSLSSSQQSQYEKDITRLFPSHSSLQQIPLETLQVHIPVSSGDGYFRLRVTTGKSSKSIAESPVFRVGSLSLSSAHPQGASMFGLVPELVVRSAFITVRTTAWATFYASFPLLKIAEWTPGPWRAYALRILYSHSLTPDQQSQISGNIAKGKVQLQKANESIYRKVPFGAVGVRTVADLQRDEEMGRVGILYKWEGN